MRRAIVGMEPTGLHALFKTLWNELGKRTPEDFAKVVGEKPTIHWPTDAELKTAIKTRPLAKTRIINYLLVEYDKSLKGDHPSDAATIEHVLPQTYAPRGPWSSDFKKAQHKSSVDLWANIIPLSQPLNASLQASGYSVKQKRYLKESMFIGPRTFAEKWSKWTPNAVERRSNVLVKWAVKCWPYYS